MSAPGRPKRESLPPGGTARSAKGAVVRAPGRPKRESLPPGGTARGFTLLELLIALAILAMLSVLGYRATASLADSEVRLTAETARWRALDALFVRLEADLRKAQPRGARTAAGLEPAWLGAVDAEGNSDLRFSRAGPEFTFEAGSAGQRLGYRLRNSAVEVLYWPYLDIAPGSLPAAYALADGITRFRVEYLDSRGATHERWPVAGEPALPRAVRVTLTLAGGETVERWLVLQ
jgi:general secretion pathway protein J